MNRNITGTIRKTDGAVWAGAAVEFELERSSYDDSAQYPMHVVRAVADENGEIALTLWVNEEALRPSRYICTMPDGCQFRFTLPEGAGDADLAALRESAIEEDSPTQSTLVAFLPAVRVEAQHVVDQTLAGVNAALDLKADQTSLDATDAAVTQLADGAEILSSRLDTKAEQMALNIVGTNLAALALEVEGKASQTALDTVNVNLAALDAEVETKAGQLALDATNATVSDIEDSLFTANSSILSLSNGLAAANTQIAAKANQSGLNITNVNVNAVTSGLADANTAIATKASQADLNNLVIEVGTKAKQISLDDTDANVAQITSDLDSLSHEVADKASQADLGVTNLNLEALDNALGTTNANLAAANTAIATKANQSSLNTTNANVTTLTNGLATASADIATRATQTALNTTNSNVAALSTVVATKASQSALDSAVSSATAALANKSDLGHTHEPGEIADESLANSIGYFDSNGELTGSGQFVFSQDNLGLGTGEPEYTLDLRHPNAQEGNQARIYAVLNNPSPILQLVADPNALIKNAAINLDCSGVVNSVDSNVDGVLGLGQEGVTTGITFRSIYGSLTFLGLKTGPTEPTDMDFPPYTFGFYKQSNPHGFFLDAFYLAIHDGEVLQLLSFGGK